MAPDLDLVSAPPRSDDRRVERLIHVGFGRRDEVVKSLLNRCPLVVDDAQCGVTVLHVIGQHAHGHQVVDFLVRQVSAHHLEVDGPEVLRTPGHLGGDACLGERLGEWPLHLHNLPLSLFSSLPNLFSQCRVCLRLEVFEGQVLEFPPDRSHS